MELQGVQQFLQVPSSGIGSSPQIISIPLNLLTQGNQQSISLLTSNGQIIQIPSLQFIQTPQNNDNQSQQQQQQQQILTTNSNSQQQSQQHILINQNGQLISLPLSSFQSAGSNSVGTTSTTTTTTANSNIITLPSNINLSSLNTQNTISQVQPQTVKQQQQQHNSTLINNNNHNSHDQHDFKLNNNQQRSNNPGTTPIKTLLEEDDNKSEASLDDQGPTIANLPDRK